MTDVTTILQKIEKGDAQAAEQLLPLVYEGLRRLAASRMAQEKPGQTLQATALVHEAYVRLVDGKLAEDWNSRGHFFGAAAEAMRRILVERARRKNRQKHGGDREREPFDDVAAPESDHRLLALDDALTVLAEQDSVAAEVVKLRHFCGLNHEEVAKTLAITVYQARQKWNFARAWLRIELQNSP